MKENSYKYIQIESIPHGLASQLNPIFDTNLDHKASLNAARSFLERLLLHLSSIAGIKIREISSKIDKLTSDEIISKEISPYFHLWWNISCLGSHFQEAPSLTLTWEQHLETCKLCIEHCITWYLKNYPPISINQNARQNWISDASLILSAPHREIQVCQESNIHQRLECNHSLLLTGKSWVGKTSIASWFVTEYVGKGYIPLVFHENSLVTFRAISDSDEESSPKNLRHASNAQKLHELIVKGLFHGESFIIFLDDPFGHRHFNVYNPLIFLQIGEWLALANHPLSLGSVKVIITTPSIFLQKAKQSQIEYSKTNPVAKFNQNLLDNELHLSLDFYNKKQIFQIVRFAARTHNCTWADNDDRCDIVADSLTSAELGFDSLQLLCRDLKTATDDEFIERVIKLITSINIQDAIQSTSVSTKFELMSAFVGESLIEFYREFCFETKMHFSDILKASMSCDFDLDEVAFNLTDWLLMDKVSTFKLLNFPVFSHPEVRHAVASLAESEYRQLINVFVTNLSGINAEFDGLKLARWEGVHLICRMAPFITDGQCQVIYEEFFCKRISGGGDPRNVLWAIIGNWNYIQESPLENFAFGFLKQISNNYKFLCRPLIWESVANWSLICEKIRMLVIAQTSRSDDNEIMKPIFHEHNTLAFMAAGVVHFGAIQEAARYGCAASEKFIEYLNIFIDQLLKKSGGVGFTSRMGDGLFDAPGSRFSGLEICKRLLELGLRCRSLDPSSPLAMQLTRSQ